MGNKKVTLKTPSSFRLTVELSLFFFVFCTSLSDGVITNLLLRQSCWYEEGLPLEICKGRHQTIAQQKASYVESCKILIETILPTILSLFIGPWSDTNGRKLILISPLIGYIISYGMWASLSLIKDLNPAYLLFASLPIVCSGGCVTLYVACFCYLADVTNKENRALRMGIAEAALNVGQLVGYFTSPYLFKSIENGYWIVFATNALILILNCVYIIIFLPETVKLPEEERKNLFRLDHLKDTYNTVMTPRKCYGTQIILLNCFISFLSMFIIFGEASIKYLSLIKVFDWELSEYALYNTIALTAVFVASSVGIWLGGTILRISDDLLLIFSLLLRILSGIFMGISKTTTFFYIGTLLASFRSFAGPLIRSQLSKIVPQKDVGKVFSFLSSVDAFPQFGIPVYCSIYAAVVSSYPFAIYFFSAGLSLVAAVASGTIMTLKKVSSHRTRSTRE